MKSHQQTSHAYHYDTSSNGISATRQSAAVIVPDLVKRFQLSSVLDIGCGLGDWLAEFSRWGCSKVTGIDGDWVPLENLQIPKNCFHIADLTGQYPNFPNRFDLSCSLEVAEHIPPDAGVRLIKRLTDSADLVLFSAAIPHQGGYLHINEQYQSHWIQRFADLGYDAFDLIRPRIWRNEHCDWWYQQNLLVFANKVGQARHNLTRAEFIPDLVHPLLYERASDPRSWGGRMMIKMLFRKLANRFGL
jgi:SAM-dependent methyltransferase